MLDDFEDRVLHVIFELDRMEAIVEELVRRLQVLRVSVRAWAEYAHQVEERKASSAIRIKLFHEHETVGLCHYYSVVSEKVMEIQRRDLLLAPSVNAEEGIQDNERVVLREDLLLYLAVAYRKGLLLYYLGN